MSIVDEYEILNWELENHEEDLEGVSDEISQVMCNSCRNCRLYCYKLLI